MMLLYEVNARIAALIDPETGEMTATPEELAELFADRDEAIESVLLTYKNLAAEDKALTDEIEALTARRKTVRTRKDKYKDLAADALGGEKFSTARVKASYRKSSATEVTDPETFWEWAMRCGEQYIRYKEPEADKTAIGNALKQGIEVPGCSIVESINIQIK